MSNAEPSSLAISRACCRRPSNSLRPAIRACAASRCVAWRSTRMALPTNNAVMMTPNGKPSTRHHRRSSRASRAAAHAWLLALVMWVVIVACRSADRGVEVVVRGDFGCRQLPFQRRLGSGRQEGGEPVATSSRSLLGCQMRGQVGLARCQRVRVAG